MSRQKLGQHFLTAPWRRRILDTLPRQPPDVWLEIGAGHGEITELLAPRARRVIAIETDPSLARRLQERARDWPSVEVVPGDVLSLDLPSLIAGERIRVYGNLPYYITSPILHRLFSLASHIASIHIVIQFEVAVRVVARPGRREYGYLSAATQFYTYSEIALRIPPGAFRPPPKVTSALVRMNLPGEREHLAIADEPAFLKFVQTCFSQKRKTLRNNLKAVASEAQIRGALQTSGLRDDARAEQLTLAQFASLFNRILNQS